MTYLWGALARGVGAESTSATASTRALQKRNCLDDTGGSATNVSSMDVPGFALDTHCNRAASLTACSTHREDEENGPADVPRPHVRYHSDVNQLIGDTKTSMQEKIGTSGQDVTVPHERGKKFRHLFRPPLSHRENETNRVPHDINRVPCEGFTSNG